MLTCERGGTSNVADPALSDDDLERAIERIELVHRFRDAPVGEWCDDCDEAWPCETLRAVRRLRTENETLRAQTDATIIFHDERALAAEARLVELTEAGEALAKAVDDMSLAWTVPMIPNLAKHAAAWRSLVGTDEPNQGEPPHG